MNENTQNADHDALEQRSRALFSDSVDGIDMRALSKLTRARHRALEVAAASSRQLWFLRLPVFTSLAGVAGALLVGTVLWFGALGNHVVPRDSTNLEDLDILAVSDGGSVDALELLQDDIEFYDFADKSANSEPVPRA